MTDKKEIQKQTAAYDGEYLLQVKNLRKHFPIGKAFFKKNQKYLKAVDGVSFNLKRGKTVGIVGESGCGKTTMGRTVLRLYEPTDGEIIFEGRDIAHLEGEELRNEIFCDQK